MAEEKGPVAGGGWMDQLPESLQSVLTTEGLVELMWQYGPRVIAAAAILFFGRMLARMLTAVAVRGARRARVEATLLTFLRHVIGILLQTAVVLAALECVGINTMSLTAVLAAAGFAVGLALQGSLGNFASGVLIVFFKPFRVGDYVEIGGQSGVVIDIQIFSTVLRSLDHVRIVVPNGTVTAEPIRNYSAEPVRRVDLLIGCAYHDDLKGVKQLLEKVVNENSYVLEEPLPQIAVAELGDSSVNFVVRPWVATEDYWDARFSLIEAVKLGFDREGYTFPFPSRDLFHHGPESVVQEPTVGLHSEAA